MGGQLDHYNNRQMKWKPKAQVSVSEKESLLIILHLAFCKHWNSFCTLPIFLIGTMTRKLWIIEAQ